MPLGPQKSKAERLFALLAAGIRLPLLGLGAVTAVAFAVIGSITVWRTAEWIWRTYLSAPWRM